MKKQNTTAIILFIVLGVGVIAYFFIVTNQNKYQWYENYSAESDQPYGLLYLKKMLVGYHPEGKFTYNKTKPLESILDTASKTPTDYVFIGQAQYLSATDREQLRTFIRKGNNAFIASVSFPGDLLEDITMECDETMSYDGINLDTATLNFYHDTLRTAHGYSYSYRMVNKDIPYYWNKLSPTALCDSTKLITALGYVNPNEVNFFSINYGKGKIYLCSTPLVFTNYFMRQEDKMGYASGVFSHLNGRDIIWDEFSKVPLTRNENNSYDSPLYFILQQPSLKYAWWLMLIGIVLYVMFTAKRSQRIIPILEPKANTSLEFIKLISNLHYQNPNHLDMARKKMKYFQYFIRQKYGFHFVSPSPDQIARLAEKARIPPHDVNSIFSQYAQIEEHAYYNIDAARLATFYYAVENFYKHCK